MPKKGSNWDIQDLLVEAEPKNEKKSIINDNNNINNSNEKIMLKVYK